MVADDDTKLLFSKNPFLLRFRVSESLNSPTFLKISIFSTLPMTFVYPQNTETPLPGMKNGLTHHPLKKSSFDTATYLVRPPSACMVKTAVATISSHPHSRPKGIELAVFAS